MRPVIQLVYLGALVAANAGGEVAPTKTAVPHEDVQATGSQGGGIDSITGGLKPELMKNPGPDTTGKEGSNVFDVSAWGAVPGVEADATPGILAAVAAAAALPNGTVVLKGGRTGAYRTTSTIVIPPNVSLHMENFAEIVYEGSGVAIRIDGDTSQSRMRKHALRVRKASQTWHLGLDRTSVGVQLRNCNDSEVRVEAIQGFWKGLELLGDGAGTSYNTIWIGAIINNMIGVGHSARPKYPDGWANGNTFIGGRIRVDTANAGIKGTVLFEGGTMNGSTLLGINMEGSAPEVALSLSSASNVIIGCRWEAANAGAVQLRKGADFNIIVGGFGNLGPGTKVAAGGRRLFDDKGTGNIILGGMGLQLLGDNGRWGSEALALRAANSAGARVLTVDDSRGEVRFDISANGAAAFYGDPGGADAVNERHPRVTVEGRSGSIAIGDGLSEPRQLFVDAIGPSVELRLPLVANKGGRVGSSVLEMQGSDLDLVAAGHVVGLANSSRTVVRNIANGSAGQILSLIARNSNTTVATTPHIRLSGARDWAMTTGDVLTLLLDTGGVWREVARTDMP